MASSGGKAAYGVLNVDSPVSTHDAGGDGSDSDAGSDTELVAPPVPTTDTSGSGTTRAHHRSDAGARSGRRGDGEGRKRDKGMPIPGASDGFQAMSVELRASTIAASPPQFTVRAALRGAAVMLALWV